MKAKVKDIQWYDHRTQTMAQSQKYKIKKLLEFDCIRQIMSRSFLCMPIPGYNSRTYKIARNGDEFNCNCQHYTMKHTSCSHIGAVREWLAMRVRKDTQLEMEFVGGSMNYDNAE